MRAIRVEQFGGPEVLQVKELPDPKPGPREVLVRLKAAGVNPVDTYVRSGLHGKRPLPYTPGQDGAGTIEKVGPEVSPELLGKRVYLSAPGSGTYAEKAAVPFFHVHPLPDHLSFEQGAALFVTYTTAYQALFLRGRAIPGETVLIHGASGGVGLAALQWARSYGMLVLGTAGTQEGLDFATRHGAHAVFNHREAGYRDKIAQATGGQGPNLILEMLANVNLQHDLDMVAMRGRVVIIGNRGSLDFNPRGAMAKEADVLGMSMMNLTMEEVARIQAAIHAGLDKRFLDPVVSRTFALEESGDAHQAVLESGTLGKLAILL